jgi:hypothetical protein
MGRPTAHRCQILVRIPVLLSSDGNFAALFSPDTKESIMKNVYLITAVIGTAMLIAPPVFALADEPWEPYPELLESRTLNAQDRPAYVGTGLSDTRKRVHIGGAPNPAFPNHDIDETGYIVGTAGPEKGHGDEYGSVLFDVGALRE